MTNNPIIAYVESAINYIEENIDQALTADLIATENMISKSHLQRIFKTVTGQSLMDYVRSRKLSRCLVELIDSDLTVVDIALKYGYDYEQSFSRAFKSKFGISPHFFRNSTIGANITPKMDLSFIIDLKDSLIAKPKFVKLPAFQIGGITHRVTIKEKFKNKPTDIGHEFFYNKRLLIDKPKNPTVYYGYTMEDFEREESSKYFTGVEIDEHTILPEGFQCIDIAENNYIMFKLIGNFPASEITWKHLDEIWTFRDFYMEKYHGITERIYGYFEYIDETVCDDNYCELDLYVPIGNIN
ncbi:MAG: helix-turn-helix domain-containing protein [Clostridiales bacterium]|nr:helix-turn-helix domain-containing protein [Clostridiales bacterium]